MRAERSLEAYGHDRMGTNSRGEGSHYWMQCCYFSIRGGKESLLFQKYL
jgi:hypothetical protein